MASNPQSAGPWPKGVNNRQAEHALPPGTLRNAVNVDIDGLGFLRRRSGFQKVLGGVNMRGGFNSSLGTFYVAGNALYRWNADNTSTLLTSGVNGQYAAYWEFNSSVYFSDGVTTKRIDATGIHDWGQAVPAAPELHGINGSLPLGTYVAAITAVDSTGRESGASETAEITFNAASGLRVTGIDATRANRIYLTTTNGSTLFMVIELPAGTASYDITSISQVGVGRPLETQFMSKPPAGRIIREYKGRLYIADGNTLWYTDPYDFDKVALGRNFFQFQAPITVVEPVTNGLWVVAEATYFYSGTGPGDFKPLQGLNYGAIYGTSQLVPYTNDAMWYSERGVVLADENGQITNLQEAQVAAPSGTVGAGIIREQDGLRQMIVSVRDPVVSPLAAKDFIQMEIVRKGTNQ